MTESLLKEIQDQLRKSKLVKIKMNKGLIEAAQRKDFWKALAEGAETELIDQKGNVAVFWKH